MSAASLVLRVVMFPVILLVVGTIGVFGFTVIEPFYAAFGEPPASLGWGTPASSALAFVSFSFIGLFLVAIIWFVYAPIRTDTRQQYRRY